MNFSIKIFHKKFWFIFNFSNPKFWFKYQIRGKFHGYKEKIDKGERKLFN